MDIEKLKREYATQDNAATAYPIYVQVQELRFVGIIEEGYDVCCPFGDGEIRYEHNCEFEHDCKTDGCIDCDEEDEPEHCKNDRRCGYIWIPVEFFLTRKGAEEYIKANQHNHGKLRTYVCHFERRNFEMRELLKELGFKSDDK